MQRKPDIYYFITAFQKIRDLLDYYNGHIQMGVALRPAVRLGFAH